ncbi:MAG: ABC transporter [Ectothiorhodospiraceae bacterium]|nr:ABC transporter [Ectothiorhodospiraceae bacterium]
MQQVFYLVQKEFRQVFRSKIMIGILFVAPLIQILVLGNAVTTDVTNLKVVLFDNDRTPMSRELLRRLANSEYFIPIEVEDDYTKLSQYMDRFEANLALAIPGGFQRDVVRKSAPKVQAMVDGLDGNSAGIALGYVAAIVQKYNADIIMMEPGLRNEARAVRQVKLEPRFWFNPNLESRVYIVPGLIAIILTIITVFLTGMGIVREKEIGTLEQLMVTPIRSWQLILGKIIPFAVLGFIEIIIIMVFVYILFGIGVAGSIPLLLFESGIFILTTLGLGIFISTISETQQQALFFAWFFMIFGILLSGFFIPIANMPEVIQWITYLNPLRYFLVILREIYLKGSPLAYLLPETFAMIAFGLAVFTLAVVRFRQRLV